MTPVRIGHYEVVEKIGEGGMGVVYRATDTRLGRPVALKIVSEAFTRDPDARARLMREARVAAALNHPSICTIHDVLDLRDTADDDALRGAGAAIVFEFVEGVTLADRLAAGPLPLRTVVDLAVQLAEGLAAAHERGVVHRDLKPQNVIVTPDGRVKILDFGLARATSLGGPVSAVTTQTDLAPSRAALDGAAIVRGTVPYMSPEQAAGRAVDHRSDLFSLGVVLFEMATGQRPFRGETSVEVLSKILEAQPPPVTALRPDAPGGLDRIVRIALAKSPGDRYQHTGDLVNDLREIQDLMRTASRPRTAVKEPRAFGSGLGVTALLVIASIAAIAVAWTMWSRAAPARPLEHTQVTFVGDASYPTVSPDAAFVAYVRGEPWGDDASTLEARAPQRVMVQDVAGGSQPVPVAECLPCLGLSWSPDSRSLAISTRTQILIVPRLGGDARTFDARGNVAWHPDGLRFAHAADSRRELRIVTVRDGAAATVAIAGLTGAIADVDWSPQGDRFVVLTEADGRSLLWLVTADGMQTTKIVDEAARISGFTLTRDGSAVLFQREAGAGVELVAVNLPGGMSAPRDAPTVLVSGVTMGPRFSLAADGRTVYYTRELRFSNLWSESLSIERAGRGASRDGGDTARPITEGSFLDQYPAVSPDGARVAFVRRAGNSSDVFAVSATGGAPRQVSFLGSIMGAPAWSPEGDALAACASDGGAPQIWTIDLQKGQARPVPDTPCTTLTSETPITWAPASRIAYQLPGNQNYRLLDPASGAQAPLLPSGDRGWIFAPVISPDASAMAVYWNLKDLDGGDARGIWLLPQPAGEPRRIFSGFSWPLRWSADGRWLFVYVPQPSQVVALPRDGGAARVVGDLSRQRVALAPSVTPDGRTVIYSVHAIHADVWKVIVDR